MKFLNIFHFFFENEASGKNRPKQQPVQVQQVQQTGETFDDNRVEVNDFDFQDQDEFFD